jgi:hypothetical protein
MIEKSLIEAIERMIEKGWDKIYFLVDIHGTIFKPSYNETDPCIWLGESRDALREMTKAPWISLILWTSTYPSAIVNSYLPVFEREGIKFDYINGNPEVLNGVLGCFDKKPYFNLLLDDKAGFEEEDWSKILKVIRKYDSRRSKKDISLSSKMVN